MKRIDFDITQEQEFAPPRREPTRLLLAFGSACLVFALFVSAAAAGEYAPCDKVKTGRTGHFYAFKADC